ncbi:MAG: hypothetical protein CMP07_10610 [Xanthomonadales bacterium]|nr:hypothetical protein [Xanthomonadales bacterium]|tara:strand:+ start:1521 stop:1703 length:183 start_codon:yes stop_codon:yes gene_type:complete
MRDSGDRVTVVDIEMPFWSIVIFLVKLAIAAIPAMIILWVFGVVLALLLHGIFGGLAQLR